MAKVKSKATEAPLPIPPAAQELPLYCTCCPDAAESKVIRKAETNSSVDDQPWQILGRDGKWRPIRSCPWCRRELG